MSHEVSEWGEVEWKNRLGITKAVVGLEVRGQTSADHCTFAMTPIATPHIDTALGSQVTVIGPIIERTYKGQPRTGSKCETVDVYVAHMNYQVSWGIWLPWGGNLNFGSATGGLEVCICSDGRHGWYTT